MRKKSFYQYYVEGEGEKHLLNALKTELWNRDATGVFQKYGNDACKIKK